VVEEWLKISWNDVMAAAFLMVVVVVFTTGAGLAGAGLETGAGGVRMSTSGVPCLVAGTEWSKKS
jgi:hypothetical protein